MRLKKSRASFVRLLVAAVLLLALAVPIWAADEWTLVGKSKNGEYYLRHSSIEDNGNYIIGWVKIIPSETTTPLVQLLESFLDSEISYIAALYGAKKGSRQIRQIQSACYDENDTVVFSMNEYLVQQSGFGEWMHCPPNGEEEMLWEALMKAAGVRY